VAVLDFEESSGHLHAGATFIPAGDNQWGMYDVQIPLPGSDVTPEFIQVNVLATILKTMNLIEHERVLGRKLSWAFNAPQLLVVPRAGEWANAYYERESHSLQFFYFQSKNERIYTSLSRDIIAHETAHAILDGIAPDLYNALSPQSLAFHEAFADLTAVLMAMQSRKLAVAVLEQTGGNLWEYTTAFNQIAEQYGREGRGDHCLRDLSKTIGMHEIDSVDPHALSVVLSSALYEMLVLTYKERLRSAREELQQGNTAEVMEEQNEAIHAGQFSLSGKVLALAANQFARMIYRALDYLPPGEVSFADYGRAIIAADKVAYPSAEPYRDFLRDAFVARQIVSDRNKLDSDTDFEYELDRPVDIVGLVESDWVAYEFANRPKVRDLLCIPDSVESFQVHPRLRTEKRFTEDGQAVDDIVFKVSWGHVEANNVGNGLSRERRITTGTTLIINANKSHEADNEQAAGMLEVAQSPVAKRSTIAPYKSGKIRLWGTGRDMGVLHIRARLTGDLGQQQERDAMLRQLLEEDLIDVNSDSVDVDGRINRTAIQMRTRNNVLEVRGTARMLHISAR
jgi:hypothetical protein